MKIADLLARKGRDVATVAPHRTVAEALGMLVERGIGSLVVVEEGTIRGIITERDVLRTLNRDPSAPERHRVEDVMSPDPIVAKPGDDVHYVMDVMTRNRVRHLPVLNDATLEGLVSIGDVVDALRQDAESENRYLKDYVQGRTR